MTEANRALTNGMYAAAVAVSASLLILLLGAVAFGLDFATWAEWQGGLVGVLGTVAGVAGAAVGLELASRRRL